MSGATAEEIRQWFQSAHPSVRLWMSGINFVNHLHFARNEAFQMPGRHDGSISPELKEIYKAEYESLTNLIVVLGEAKQCQ